MKTAVFPGSFDPITLGHVSLAQKALAIFDELVILVGNNPDKRYEFTPEQRLSMARETFENNPKVRVEMCDTFVVEYMKAHGLTHLDKGVRDARDFSYEADLARCNRLLNPDCETVLLLPDVQYASVSSTFVREVIRYGGDLTAYAPEPVIRLIKHINQ